MVNNILKTLEEKANKELGLILEEQEKALLGLKEDFQEKSERKKAKEKDALEKTLEKEVSALSQQLSFKYNFATQDQKAKGLDEVYQATKEKLSDLPEEAMEKFLKKIAQPLTDKEGVISAGKKTAPILKRVIKGEKIKVEDGLKEEGFLFKAKDIEIDLSFSSLVKELKEKIGPQLAKIIYA